MQRYHLHDLLILFNNLTYQLLRNHNSIDYVF